jgi:hypothetical protein
MASTEQTSDAVRRIVEEVLRRIAAEAAGAARPASGAVPPRVAASAAAATAPAAATGAAFTERVITLDMLVRLPAGTRQVTVPPRAVVTPSARDHARDIGLSLVTATTSPAAGPASIGSLAIAHADCGGDATRRCAAIARAVPASQQLPPSGLADVVAALAAHAARDGGRGVLLTGRPAVAAVLANRHPGVRAIVARDPGSAARAAAECTANLLVVNPADFTGGLERAVAGFATRDRATVPAELAAATPAATPCSCKTHSH